MKILIAEPGETPRRADIPHTLKDKQRIVDGCIQAVCPWDDPVALVCDEEGLINSKPLNRYIIPGMVIAGTFFVCGLGEEDFADLPDKLTEKYEKLLICCPCDDETDFLYLWTTYKGRSPHQIGENAKYAGIYSRLRGRLSDVSYALVGIVDDQTLVKAELLREISESTSTMVLEIVGGQPVEETEDAERHGITKEYFLSRLFLEITMNCGMSEKRLLRSSGLLILRD